VLRILRELLHPIAQLGRVNVQVLRGLLIGRKILRDDGRAMRALIADMERAAASFDGASGDDLVAIRRQLQAAIAALSEAVGWIRSTGRNDINSALAGATPFLHLLGIVCGGWQMARAAVVAQTRLPPARMTPHSIRPRSRPRGSRPTIS
jgi:3-(methylsulfanyl)propanoyl-CoA dehydrogenase